MKDLVEKTITETFAIPGGLTVQIKGLKVKFSKTDNETYMDLVTIAKRDQEILVFLIKYYSESREIPGKTANWIRKTIGLSIKDLCELSHIDQSTFSHATTRNSNIDKLTAVILLNLASDHVTGGSKGKQLIETALHVGASLKGASDLKIEKVA